MCWCNPNLRTPHCGKPTCVPPAGQSLGLAKINGMNYTRSVIKVAKVTLDGATCVVPIGDLYDLLEGGQEMAETIEHLTQRGIPVMAHVGLTPQSVNTLGGYRVQGRGNDSGRVRNDAVAVAEAGAFSVVLEKVPAALAGEITRAVAIPTIGIGASAAGARAYTATASQGLLFMAEAVYNASGLGLPIVMTVANRAIGAPINIWNDHSDSMSQRDSGWLQLFAESNQEALDLHIQAFKLA